jgi:hypothetical protein
MFRIFQKFNPIAPTMEKARYEKTPLCTGSSLAHPERLELPTRELEARCSIRLSYGCLPTRDSKSESAKTQGLRDVQKHRTNRTPVAARVTPTHIQRVPA